MNHTPTLASLRTADRLFQYYLFTLTSQQSLDHGDIPQSSPDITPVLLLILLTLFDACDSPSKSPNLALYSTRLPLFYFTLDSAAFRSSHSDTQLPVREGGNQDTAIQASDKEPITGFPFGRDIGARKGHEDGTLRLGGSILYDTGGIECSGKFGRWAMRVDNRRVGGKSESDNGIVRKEEFAMEGISSDYGSWADGKDCSK
jgi:hypothetical protein